MSFLWKGSVRQIRACATVGTALSRVVCRASRRVVCALRARWVQIKSISPFQALERAAERRITAKGIGHRSRRHQHRRSSAIGNRSAARSSGLAMCGISRTSPAKARGYGSQAALAGHLRKQMITRCHVGNHERVIRAGEAVVGTVAPAFRGVGVIGAGEYRVDGERGWVGNGKNRVPGSPTPDSLPPTPTTATSNDPNS